LEAYRSHRAVLAIVTSLAADPTGYGRVLRTRGRISRVVEQKDCSEKLLRINECNAGVYVVDSDFLWKSLPQTRNTNAQREFYLTDLVAIAAAKKKLVDVDADFAETAGINDRQDLADCARALRKRVNSGHLKNGVTLQDPDTAYIDEGVQIGRDTEIGPVVSLCGASRVGEGVRIGQGSVIVDSIIGNGTEVRPYSHLEGSRVGENCILGPFCHLRPGTDLAESVHLGNFVETKKTSIGKASKANHLSYLGDARIGAGVNIGAGTITCNYDGVNKHLTVIEEGAFIGSDSTLVAPVRIGKGAYVAAGSTITEDVPAESLALGRSRQTTKPGWAQQRRENRAKAGASAQAKSEK